MASKLATVEVRYYAQLREGLRLSRETVELQLPISEEEILRLLADLHPAHGKLILASRVAVEDEYLPREARISELASFDVISPVSGG